MLKDPWNVLGCLKVNCNPTVQVCDPETISGQAATLRLNVAMKRGTVNRAWQVKMNSNSIAWLISK